MEDKMIAYSIIMFAISILFLVISIAIYRGNTNLIHSYHQSNVSDKEGYGRAFGKALLPLAIGPFISGVISLLVEDDVIILSSMGAMVLGLVISLVMIFVVQKKYNGGMF
jgi:maltodextrin utilization protein YvdJ